MNKRKWLVIIGNNQNLSKSDFKQKKKGIGYTFYCDFDVYQKRISNETVFVHVDGNVMPSMDSGMNVTRDEINESIVEGYIGNPNSLVENYKGNFVIVVGNNKQINIFSDHLGIKKFFYTEKNKVYYVSNDISIIRKIIDADINNNHIALYSITNRFIGGITIFNDIYYSHPATNFCFNGKRVNIGSFWSVENLLNLAQRNSNYKEYSKTFLDIIKQYLEFYNPRKISLTLTGGSDSRILLGSLLYHGYEPKTFTFGNPKSGDSLVASGIATNLGLDHANHFESNLTPSWFHELTKKILKTGNSLINYHRAYRLDGLLREKSRNPDSTITIVGHAGGETIRGLFYDNLIVTNLIRQWSLDKKANNKDVLLKSLRNRFIITESLDIEYIIEFLNKISYLKTKGKKREFLLIFRLLIANHLYQDLNLYDTFHSNLITPFMDLDYLRFLFSTQYSMLHKKNDSRNQLRRLNIPELHCNVINYIYPDLTKFRLNNDYAPSEYLKSKFLYLLKRAWRKYTGKTPQPNFYYGSWFKKFIESKWPQKPPDWMVTLFDLDLALNLFQENKHGYSEKYWIKYSSLIMLYHFSKYY